MHQNDTNYNYNAIVKPLSSAKLTHATSYSNAQDLQCFASLLEKAKSIELIQAVILSVSGAGGLLMSFGTEREC